MSLKWTSQNIKLESTDSNKICSARLRLTKNKDTWLLKFNSFWLKPQSAELWMIGSNAKMLLKFDNVTGNYSMDKEFKALEWDKFFYNAQCCALYSSGKVIMKGSLSGASPISDMAMQTMLISARRQDNLPIKKEKSSPKKSIEFQKVAPNNLEEPEKQELPKVATIPVKPVEKSAQVIRQEESLNSTSSIKELTFDIPKVVSDKGFLKKHKTDEVFAPTENINTKLEFDIPINVRQPESVLKDINIDFTEKEELKEPSQVIPQDVTPKVETLNPEAVVVDLKSKSESTPELNTPEPIPVPESAPQLAQDLESPPSDKPLPSQPEATNNHELPKLDDIKKLLARKPIDRTVSSVREVKINPEELKPVKCDFMLWNVERIENEVDNNPTESPFVGTFKGSRFSRVEISTKDTFDHLLVGKVPLDNIPVYMLCIPGSATNPPIGVEGFGRWIPTKDGKGYWVKYITK